MKRRSLTSGQRIKYSLKQPLLAIGRIRLAPYTRAVDVRPIAQKVLKMSKNEQKKQKNVFLSIGGYILTHTRVCDIIGA